MIDNATDAVRTKNGKARVFNSFLTLAFKMVIVLNNLEQVRSSSIGLIQQLLYVLQKD